MLSDLRIMGDAHVAEDWEMWLTLAEDHPFVHVHRRLYGYRMSEQSKSHLNVWLDMY